MIGRAEILEVANQLSLRPDIVEKDYVLGWLLAAIGHHSEAGRSWVFKGATCLKKVHFETYRFSEDLDFTLRDGRRLSKVSYSGSSGTLRSGSMTPPAC